MTNICVKVALVPSLSEYALSLFYQQPWPYLKALWINGSAPFPVREHVIGQSYRSGLKILVIKILDA